MSGMFSLGCSEGEPPTKKPKTTSVVVEQAGQSDKVVIDHIPDTDSVFEEVRLGCYHYVSFCTVVTKSDYCKVYCFASCSCFF